jgi:hypothetical protein
MTTRSASLSALVFTLVVGACSSGGASNTSGNGGSLSDCPPCWQQLFCWVPPDLGDNFPMMGASDGAGGCTISSASDSVESISVPLECGGPSKPSVPWSVGMNGADVTIIFGIPSKGTVNCVKS